MPRIDLRASARADGALKCRDISLITIMSIQLVPDPDRLQLHFHSERLVDWGGSWMTRVGRRADR